MTPWQFFSVGVSLIFVFLSTTTTDECWKQEEETRVARAHERFPLLTEAPQQAEEGGHSHRWGSEMCFVRFSLLTALFVCRRSVIHSIAELQSDPLLLQQANVGRFIDTRTTGQKLRPSRRVCSKTMTEKGPPADPKMKGGGIASLDVG